MSVPVAKRGISRMEFYHTAVTLRIDLTKWLLRDFGIKNKIKRVDAIAKAAGMSPEDKEKFIDIIERNNLSDTFVECFPGWWIEERRRAIDSICSQMLYFIRMANGIYPISEQEYWERRSFQDKAISSLDALYEELQYVIEVLFTTLGVDVEKYMPFVDKIEKLSALLKGWRKADNRILTNLRKGIEVGEIDV